MVGVGGVATCVAIARREPRAIWLTIGYFTVMEALQAAGYAIAARRLSMHRLISHHAGPDRGKPAELRHGDA